MLVATIVSPVPRLPQDVQRERRNNSSRCSQRDVAMWAQWPQSQVMYQ